MGLSDFTSRSLDGETASVTLMFPSARASGSERKPTFPDKRYDGRYSSNPPTERKTFVPTPRLLGVNGTMTRRRKTRKESVFVWKH